MEMCDLSLQISNYIPSGNGNLGMFENDDFKKKVLHNYDRPVDISKGTIEMAVILEERNIRLLKPRYNKIIELKTNTNTNIKSVDIEQLEEILPNHVVNYILLYFCGQKHFDPTYNAKLNRAEIVDRLIYTLNKIIYEFVDFITDSSYHTLFHAMCKFLLKDNHTWNHPSVSLQDYIIDILQLQIYEHIPVYKFAFDTNFGTKSVFKRLVEYEHINPLERKFYTNFVIPNFMAREIKLSDAVDFLHGEYPAGVFIVNSSCQNLEGKTSVCMIASCLDKLVRAEMNTTSFKLVRCMFTQKDTIKLCGALKLLPVPTIQKSSVVGALKGKFPASCSDAMIYAFVAQLQKEYPMLYNYAENFLKHSPSVAVDVIITLVNEYITDKYYETTDESNKAKIMAMMGEMKQI